MAFKLFLKHLLNGMRLRPLQPLLLVVIIAISITISTLGLELKDYLVEDVVIGSDAENGNANISVSVGSNSTSRFLSASKAKEALTEDTKVCGIYELPFYFEDSNELVFGAISDLTQVEDVFTIEKTYTSGTLPGAMSPKKLKKCLYVTEDFAEQHGLTINSNVTLRLFNKDISYTIQAISKNVLLGQYDVLVDVTSIINMLAKESAIFQYLTEPYCKLYIHTDMNVGEAMQKLAEVFPDENVEEVSSHEAIVRRDLEAIVAILIILICLIAVFTIVSCFSILTAQRKEENDLFYSVGAKSYMLNIAGMLEMFIYWVIGAAIAVGLSFPASDLFIKLVGFTYTQGGVRMNALFISSAVMLVAAEFSMAIRIIPEKVKRRAIKRKQTVLEAKNKSLKITCIVMIIADAAITIVSATLPLRERDTAGIIAVVISYVTIFLVSKLAFLHVSKRISSSNKVPITMRYALKNCSRTESQSNVSALITVFLSLAALVGVMLAYNNGYIDTCYHALDADYIVMNATSGAGERIESIEGVDNAYNFAHVFVQVESESVITLCADDISAFSRYEIERLPEKGEIVLGKGLMEFMGKEVGEYIEVEYGGNSYTLLIIGTAKVTSNALFVDPASVGTTYSNVAFTVSAGEDADAVLGRVREEFYTDSVAIAPVSKILGFKAKNLEIYNYSIVLMYICLIAFAVIGIADNIGSGFRFREEEFACYVGAGMNKKGLRVMKFAEVMFAVVSGTLVAIILFAVPLLNTYDICIANIQDIFIYW